MARFLFPLGCSLFGWGDRLGEQPAEKPEPTTSAAAEVGSPSNNSAASPSPVATTPQGVPSSIVESVLKDLEFFPYVIVVPPAAGDQLGEGETAILPLRSLDQWLDREMAKRLGSRAVPTVSSVQLELDITSDPVVGRGQ